MFNLPLLIQNSLDLKQEIQIQIQIQTYTELSFVCANLSSVFGVNE
jgi:hypothetical protein